MECSEIRIAIALCQGLQARSIQHPGRISSFLFFSAIKHPSEVFADRHRGSSFLRRGDGDGTAFGVFFERQGQSEQQGISPKDAECAVKLMREFDGFSGVAAMAGKSSRAMEFAPKVML